MSDIRLETILGNLEPQSKILDWGCGTGNQIDFLIQQGCTNVSGFDVDPSLLRKDVDIDSDSIGWLEKSTMKWDVILCRESVYYIPKSEQPRLWQALYGALAAQGTLIVVAFNGAAGSSSWIIQKDHGIQLVLNEISLKNLALQANFHQIEIKGIKSNHRTVFGYFLGLLMWTHRNLTIRFRYILERGIDPQNPKHFTKNIVLIARKF